jgi:hypothetical protein
MFLKKINSIISSYFNNKITFKHDQSTIENVLKTKIFDSKYYSDNYALHIKDHKEGLAFFCTTGVNLGHKPSENFDPILYRYVNKDCNNLNPLIHFYKSSPTPKIPPIETIFPDIIAKYQKKTKTNEINKEIPKKKINNYLNYSKTANKKIIVTKQFNSNLFKIISPDANFFFNFFKKNLPFSFVRLPHGFWDALVIRNEIAADRRLRNFSLTARNNFASRIASAALPHHGAFVEGFFDEMEKLISVNLKSKNFFPSISFRGYSDSVDEDIFNIGSSFRYKNDRLKLLNKYFGVNQKLYNATYIKKLATFGDLYNLPKFIRKHHVVIVGPDYLYDLDKRWNLKNFKHINIYSELSQKYRWKFLDEIKNYLEHVKNLNKRPVVIFMAGGSLSYWFISSLHSWNNTFFYVDFGQAIKIWYPELKHNSPWLRLHREKIKIEKQHKYK